MVANSTYILDQETRHDTKITELMCILESIFEANEEKVVIFSQWERMTRLVKMELEKRKVGFAYLHGGIVSRKRKALLDDFHDKLECRVFLSTDAGGVGLNLQTASLVVNLDIPWNPAVLEQRIGRVHRHGQKRNVNIINLISKDSIEERMLDVLKFKSSLFAGTLGDGADEIFMGEDKFKRFMSTVIKITDAPQTPPPVTDVEIEEVSEIKKAETQPSSPPLEESRDFFTTAANLINNLSETLADKDKTQKLISNIITTDTATGKSCLKIPIANEQAVVKALDAFRNLLVAFKKT